MSFDPLNGLVCAVLPQVLDDTEVRTNTKMPTLNGSEYAGITADLLNGATYDGSGINISSENKSAIRVNKKLGSPNAFSFCTWLVNNCEAPLSDIVSVQKTPTEEEVLHRIGQPDIYDSIPEIYPEIEGSLTTVYKVFYD